MFFKSPNLKKKNIPKNYPELKMQGQDSFLEYFFWEIWRFEKRIPLSEKKHL